MATSAVPYNRVQLYRSTGDRLPDQMASCAEGIDTNQPDEVEMLAPLGGDVGFKGVGLAGLVEIFSAALTGMRIGPDILPMGAPDIATPRDMGAFVICIDPDAFVGADLLRAGMDHYLDTLRKSPARDGAHVMAPGDREWDEAHRRMATGVPLDSETAKEFRKLARNTRGAVPFDATAHQDPSPKRG